MATKGLFYRPVKAAPKKFLSFMIQDQLMTDIKTVAMVEKVSVSEAVRSLLQLGLVYYGKGLK